MDILTKIEDKEKITLCRDITTSVTASNAPNKKSIGQILNESERGEPVSKGFFYDFLTSYFLSRITPQEVMDFMQIGRTTAYERIKEVREFVDKEPWQFVTKNEFFWYWYDLHIDDL